ncbi:homoserine kinase [soil metagenome]
MSRSSSSVSLVGRTVRLEVPATTANLGAGFDALALALDLCNVIEVEAVAPTTRPVVEVTVSGEGMGQLPTDGSNRFVVMLLRGLAEGGLGDPGCGWRVRMENAIPVARGLGSSAAASVGALVGARALLAVDDAAVPGLADEDILALADEAEGHADNAAAAVHGGLCVVASVTGRPRALRIEPPPSLLAVLFIPDRPLSTTSMRAALPTHVPFADAVHNVGAATLAVAALSQGRLDLLAPAMVDRLHEPYRAAVYPELPHLIAAARDAGALGACLSGAGSTIIAFSDDPERAAVLAGALEDRANHLGLAGRSLVRRARSAGVRVLGSRPGPAFS